MNSIYHFWIDLVRKRSAFFAPQPLEDFPFAEEMLSCRNQATFPDLAIKVNQDKSTFTGGELIELKDSEQYGIASFNSTIPTATKEVAKLLRGKKSRMREQMERAGDDILSLPLRDVFYLVRGRHQGRTKVCLVHGSFFETIRVEDLIGQAFSQVMEERLQAGDVELADEIKRVLLEIFSEQESFSKVRDVEKASVKLRFRVMTEAKAEGNILNSKKYPEIGDDTVNLIAPCHSNDSESDARSKMARVATTAELEQINTFKIKHHFNGYFLVFQVPLF